MRLRSIGRLTFILAALMMWAPTAAHAEKDKASSVVAVVDVQRILQESLAAKSVRKQLDTQRAKFQTQTEAEENELRQAEKDLDKSRDQVAAATYSDREKQFRQRMLTVEQNVDARRKVLDQSYNDSMNQVHGHLVDTARDVAQDMGANIVLIKQQVVWMQSSMDITDEVLTRLNKTFPNVAVEAKPQDK